MLRRAMGDGLCETQTALNAYNLQLKQELYASTERELGDLK
ncbi:MAG: hypothetical protein AAFO75_01060 [Pseudomonadota bacterium]